VGTYCSLGRCSGQWMLTKCLHTESRIDAKIMGSTWVRIIDIEYIHHASDQKIIEVVYQQLTQLGRTDSAVGKPLI